MNEEATIFLTRRSETKGVASAQAAHFKRPFNCRSAAAALAKCHAPFSEPPCFTSSSASSPSSTAVSRRLRALSP